MTYFEGIDSQRGIAWRCADSLALRSFLGIPLHESTPDHSTLTNTRQRLPPELFAEVFEFVLRIAREKGLLSGQTVGVDSTLLEADAAMKSIVRRDTGEDWKQSSPPAACGSTRPAEGWGGRDARAVRSTDGTAFDPAVEAGFTQQPVALHVKGMPLTLRQLGGRNEQRLLPILPHAHRHPRSSLTNAPQPNAPLS